MAHYVLVDSGNEQKVERFGSYMLVRPCSQALWKPQLSSTVWDAADAHFTRENGNKWIKRTTLPSHWIVELEHLRFKIAPTDFGHLGLFPEHALMWKWMEKEIKAHKKKRSKLQVLNLFAYSGGATLVAARAGAEVCHLDASKGMVAWARENAELNGLEKAPIRWIVDDAIKFLEREVRRGNRYDGIILDPPTFGRGNRGEVFKIERSLHPLLTLCHKVLAANPLFVILSSHTPGMTPIVMHHLMLQMMEGAEGKIEMGEMVLSAQNSLVWPVPCGGYARWCRHEN